MEIEDKKNFIECKEKAISKIRKCFHPECSEKSINSHILQKNRILSSIAKDNHLWEFKINPFKSPYYYPKYTGINETFSFSCFCNKHDSKLFSKIEKIEIDFKDYESRLLFIVRTFYNELFKKLVVIEQYKCLISKSDNKIFNEYLYGLINSMELAISDLDFIKRLIWQDINQKTESFNLRFREIDRVEVILSSFFNYETTNELEKYRALNEGKDMKRLSLIFITLFPYNNKSILLMGHAREDETKVKRYFNSFFKENGKRLQKKITNLILFQCENWVCSEKFYLEKIKGKEKIFANAINFSSKNKNERRLFDINIFNEDFDKKIEDWSQEYVV